MIIDSHQHMMLPSELQIEKLEKAGVDKAILFCTAPHPEKARTLSELQGEMGSLYHILSGSGSKEDTMQRMKENIRELMQALHKYPDRFYGFGSVPLALSLEDTVHWIEKHIVFGGLKGIGEFTPGSDEQVRQLETIFQALAHFPTLPIWVHTFQPVTLNGIKILMELTQKYPKVPVIFGHMGGYHWIEAVDFAKSVPNAYLDLSAAFSTLAARIAITELPDKCLFGSDAPYGEPWLSRQMIEFLSPSSEIAEKVLGGNISGLIG